MARIKPLKFKVGDVVRWADALDPWGRGGSGLWVVTEVGIEQPTGPDSMSRFKRLLDGEEFAFLDRRFEKVETEDDGN